MTVFFLGFLVFVYCTPVNAQYPVPTPPGGRLAVHGWLYMPLDQAIPGPNSFIDCWLSHHVPEFYTDSPHNFQIIIRGSITPINSSIGVDGAFYDIPYPPANTTLDHEYTITPPDPFSLNDLIVGRINTYAGWMYNGSFDTTYDRIQLGWAEMDIISRPTIRWLNESVSVVPYSALRYLSYPRRTIDSITKTEDKLILYFAHLLHRVPDFDQIVTVSVDVSSCTCPSSSSSTLLSSSFLPEDVSAGVDDSCDVYSLILTEGAQWTIDERDNQDINARLKQDAKNTVTANRVVEDSEKPLLSCSSVTVLEEVHCMVGPGFDTKCP